MLARPYPLVTFTLPDIFFVNPQIANNVPVPPLSFYENIDERDQDSPRDDEPEDIEQVCHSVSVLLGGGDSRLDFRRAIAGRADRSAGAPTACPRFRSFDRVRSSAILNL